ncbi:MAG: 2-isopropylmalate synthase [Thermosulfidibacteraceae bacterium]|jgi:2-isopropylmalate synthase
MDRIIIFDTTLRDGEQAPGFSMTLNEKLMLAQQLARLGVDVIEAGFAASSPGDFSSVRKIAEEVKGPIICSLARANKKDIEAAAKALEPAERKRIHTFIATSEIHMKYKLKMDKEEVLARAIEAVKFARNFTDDVEFSAEDATRSDLNFLCKIFEEVIKAGATTINIPDTVGYAIPSEFKEKILYIINRVPNIDKVILSVHCHNDLGLAVANSLIAIEVGVRQVECTINGIGERAGNAALEEIVMAIKTRRDHFKLTTNINTKEIYRTSQLLSHITGVYVQPNKAIVGKNAFAHEAGIHQHGVLENPLTYEIMKPEDIGLPTNTIVLGKHSGRHALKKRIEELGFTNIPDEALDKIFEKFKVIADRKKEVFDDDLFAIVQEVLLDVPIKTYQLEYLQVLSGNTIVPSATVGLRRGEETFQDSSTGDGPVDATFKAIDRITGINGTLLSYRIRAVTHGKDAVGEVTVEVKFNGKTFVGKGSSTDIIEASALAYIDTVNKYLYRETIDKLIEDFSIEESIKES